MGPGELLESLGDLHLVSEVEVIPLPVERPPVSVDQLLVHAQPAPLLGQGFVSARDLTPGLEVEVKLGEGDLELGEIVFPEGEEGLEVISVGERGCEAVVLGQRRVEGLLPVLKTEARSYSQFASDKCYGVSQLSWKPHFVRHVLPSRSQTQQSPLFFSG